MGITSLEQALSLVERFYGTERLRPNTQLLLEDILETPRQEGHVAGGKGP